MTSNHPFTKYVRDRLWNDPPVPESSLSPEQKQEYKNNGEYMYNIDDQIKEEALYLTLQIQSGLCREYLSDTDKTTLQTFYGDEWEDIFYE